MMHWQCMVSDRNNMGSIYPTQKWLDGLEEEFFAQGDLEKKLGLPTTPFMDRCLPGISTRQVACSSYKSCHTGLSLQHVPALAAFAIKAIANA